MGELPLVAPNWNPRAKEPLLEQSLYSAAWVEEEFRDHGTYLCKGGMMDKGEARAEKRTCLRTEGKARAEQRTCLRDVGIIRKNRTDRQQFHRHLIGTTVALTSPPGKERLRLWSITAEHWWRTPLHNCLHTMGPQHRSALVQSIYRHSSLP